MIRQTYQDTKTFLHIALWIVILLLIVMSSKAVLGLSAELDAPSTLLSGETANILFGSDDTGATTELSIDGALVATSSPYAWHTSNEDVGDHTLLVTATDGGGLTSTAQQTLTVQELSAALSIEEPSATEYTSTPIDVLLSVSDAVNSCSADLDGQSISLTKNANFYTGALNPSDGIYTFAVSCQTNTATLTDSHTFLLDTNPPETLSSKVENGNTISLVTSEIATCKTWREGNAESAAQSMTSLDKLTHTRTITEQGTYTFLARCTDIYGNAQTSTTRFSIDNAEEPSARIELLDKGEEAIDEDAVLPLGSYKLKLTASEAVKEPKLTFSYQGEGTRTVVLSQDENEKTWAGYLIVQEGDGEQVGSFSVELTDLQGNKGTQITEGKLFLVDTQPPEQVEGLSAMTDEDETSSRVQLRWADMADIEDVDYVVYRSQADRLNRGDKLATASTNSYVDRDAGEGGTYFYTVAAKDAAGNMGPMSKVVVATLTPAALRAADTERAYYVDDALNRIGSALTTLEAEAEKLAQTSDEDQLVIIQNAGLMKAIEDQAADLRVTREEINTLWMDLPENDFAERKEQLDTALSALGKLIPKRISIDGRVSFEQAPDSQTQNYLIGKAEQIFSTELGNAPARNAYQDSVQELMDDVTINSKILTANILFADRSEKDYVYVERQALFPRQNEPLALLEYIPKEVFDDASKISWEREPVVVERDPLIKYTLPAGDNTFAYSYFFEKNIDLSMVRDARAILMPEPSSELARNEMTGDVVAGQGLGGAGWFYILGGVLIAGLLIYFFFFDSMPAFPQQSTMYPPHGNSPGAQGVVVSQQGAQLSQNSLDALTRAIIGAFEKVKPQQAPPPTYFERRNNPVSFFKRRPIGTVPARQDPRERGSTTIIPKSEAEAFDKLVSEFNMPHEALEQHEPSNLAAGALLLQGHEHINKKEYIPAKKCYAQALEKIKREKNSFGNHRETTSELYYKLLLYKQMQSAFSAANEKNRKKLDATLNELRTIAAHLPEDDSQLVSEAKEHYRSLFKLSNKLAIEDEIF